MKKLLLLTLALILCLPPAVGQAAELPNAVWAPLSAFAEAMESGDDAAMYEYGLKILEIMEAEPDSQEKTSFLAGKYEQISRCAERLGYYDAAVDLHRRYLPYGKAMGWTDGVKYAEKKIYLLQSELNLYVKDENYYPTYYGAKFEPTRGVYFGSVYDNDPRILDFDNEKILQYFPKQNSTWLMYLEFGENPRELGRYNRYLTRAVEAGVAVEFAWNTYGTVDVAANESYIRDVIDFLSEYDTPIFLRFGAEMNIGPSGDDPEAFIKAFRYVADYAHTKENIATVWSPSDLSSLDRSYADYYPGNEYVDWVGASMYVIRYFEGKPDHGSQTDPLNTYFATDEFAHPLNRIHELMAFLEENEINKPVMIAECGVTHYVRGVDEIMNDFAVIQLRRLYGDLLIRYPRIKMINYFNVEMENEVNGYELFSNSIVNDTYHRMVSRETFLTSVEDTAPYAWRPFDGGNVSTDVEIAVVGYYPKSLYNEVQYSVDGGVWQGRMGEVPFFIRLEGLTDGPHSMTVQFLANGKVVLERTVALNVQPTIRVTVNGEEVSFSDQTPVLVNDRTMVPARGVFEKLGLSVGWDAATQTVTVTGGAETVRLSIGDSALYVGDEVRTMDVPAQIIGDRTMLPLRAVSTALGAEVSWDGDTKTAVISYQN